MRYPDTDAEARYWGEPPYEDDRELELQAEIDRAWDEAIVLNREHDVLGFIDRVGG